MMEQQGEREKREEGDNGILRICTSRNLGETVKSFRYT